MSDFMTDMKRIFHKGSKIKDHSIMQKLIAWVKEEVKK